VGVRRADRFPIDFEDYEAIGTMKDAPKQPPTRLTGTSERGRRLAEIVFKALTETTGQGLVCGHGARPV
jgi:hypothetical protein